MYVLLNMYYIIIIYVVYHFLNSIALFVTLFVHFELYTSFFLSLVILNVLILQKKQTLSTRAPLVVFSLSSDSFPVRKKKVSQTPPLCRDCRGRRAVRVAGQHAPPGKEEQHISNAMAYITLCFLVIGNNNNNNNNNKRHRSRHWTFVAPWTKKKKLYNKFHSGKYLEQVLDFFFLPAAKSRNSCNVRNGIVSLSLNVYLRYACYCEVLDAADDHIMDPGERVGRTRPEEPTLLSEVL